MLEDDNSMASQTSDEELDWEEVEVPDGAHEHEEIELHLEEPSSTPANIEITLQTRPKKDDSKKKAAGISHAERLVRIGSHKIHTVCLLANARVRNAWLNDELLHARLLSLTPLAIQNGFAMIHKSRVPDQNKRGRLFEAAVTRLVEWWTGSFFTVLPIGHIRNRTFDDVQKELSAHSFDDMAEYPAEEGEEVVRSANSLMKHALMQSGSRDTSAQLFTALCRALDIPARLVVSLQSVPWQTGIGKSKSKAATKGVKGLGKGKGKLVDISEGAEESDEERIEDTGTNSKADIKGKGKERAHDELPPYVHLSSSNGTSVYRNGYLTDESTTAPVDPLSTPPVFWTEVFSRADSRWLPIDPIRAIVNKRQVFDPSPSAASGPSRSAILQENRMLYVIALEEDGYGRDVTARYARDYTAKVAKIQGVGAGGGGRTRKEWWERVLQTVTRPYRLQRDDFEDDELHNHQLTEGMPTTMAGFKDHPLHADRALRYALSRHLKRSEVIDPPTELGKFRGEPVYPRSSVIALKTAENWMRQGRKVREGCQPMKMVTQRAVTIGRKREVEVALERARADEHGAEGAEEVLQGLYARAQTELYRPEPIVDGKIPKNDFGSIDLYVPSMLPEGGVHIPFKGVAKVAKKLGFDYAEAVTGFEFKKRKAFPVVEGIVVAAENETVIVEAYLEAEQEAEEKARVKRLDQVQKRWIRLVQGLRIRERLQKQYAPNSEGDQQPHWLDTQIADGGDEEPGGFLTTADDVVEAFHLPKDLHPAPSSSFTPPIAPNDLSGGTGKVRRDHTSVTAVGISTDEPLSTTLPNEDIEMGDIVAEVQTPRMNGLPRSMREFAEAAARQESEAAVAHPSGEKGDLAAPGSSTKSAVKASARRAGAAKGHADTPLTRALSNRKTARKRPRGNSGNVSSDPDNHTTPAKRGRRPSAPASSSTPARVLRPRPQKSAAKVQEEADMERAYRQAIKD
ncbi:Rad4-domain-containing protein [Leucogyrophana mollusca]|uniref:Rad4-domain-containing protein n=1 Tax=Leucogyrophana mollusca TaxID=85980 RepID=A0ACB8BJC4_9AGAM|nr:Rad4-domain-containing protein [Leucogyrophana mollusca]